MIRKGSTVAGYYFDHASGSWIEIHAASVSSSEDLLHLNLAAWSHDNVFRQQKVTVVFDNVIMNKGILVCHQI